KPRGMSGRRRRMIHTPAHTSTKANNVPMLVISPTMSPGTKPPKMAVRKKKMMFDFHGVRYLGWTSPNIDGTRPSRDIEENTRDCPSSITRITDEKPARIATVTSLDSHS